MATSSQISDNNAKIQFAKEVMADFKYQNITDGINAYQAIHMETRFSNIPFTQPADGTVEYNSLYNKMNTGDIDTAYFLLLYMQPDDMSKSYHWVTQDRINYIKNRLASYLGL